MYTLRFPFSCYWPIRHYKSIHMLIKHLDLSSYHKAIRLHNSCFPHNCTSQNRVDGLTTVGLSNCHLCGTRKALNLTLSLKKINQRIDHCWNILSILFRVSFRSQNPPHICPHLSKSLSHIHENGHLKTLLRKGCRLRNRTFPCLIFCLEPNCLHICPHMQNERCQSHPCYFISNFLRIFTRLRNIANSLHLTSNYWQTVPNRNFHWLNIPSHVHLWDDSWMSPNR